MTAVAQQKPKSPLKETTLAQRKLEETLTGYAFLAPAIVVFVVFLLLPIFFAVFISFTNWDGISPLAQTAKGASGKVEFTSTTTDPVTIPEGTIITSSGKTPVEFRTTAEIVVPAGETVPVDVVAVDESLGKETNVRAKLIREVPAELAEKVTVSNPVSLGNGVSDAFQMVGAENYGRLLSEEGLTQRDFFRAVKNTVYFVIGVVPTQTILALLLAVIVNQRWLRAKGIFRTAFYFPSITSSVVISIIFMWMFTQGGLINTLIKGIFPQYTNVNWLDDPSGMIHNVLSLFGVTRDTAGEWASQRLAGIPLWDWISGPSVTMFTIMILNTWTTVGTMMVIFLAALQNIPGSVYEAAQIDGATAWQTFRRITIPLLAPTTFFVVTLGLIGTFQVFDQVFVISSGGPANTTVTIAYIVYQNGFQNSEMGLAAATALILFIIIFIFTMLQRLVTRETLDI